MTISELSNDKLKEIYKDCKNVLDNPNRDQLDEKFVLKIYNEMFDTACEVLHIKMAEQVFNIVKNEMAERFYNQ